MNNALFSIKIIKAPELRYTATNQKPFAVAIAQGTDPKGEKQFQLKLICWGERANEFQADVEEGDRLIVEGSLDIQTFEKDGVKRKYAELSIGRYQLLNPAVEDLYLNCVNLVGRAGRDPEVKYFESGRVVAEFSLAINRIGSEETNWYDLAIWGRPAEVAGNYVRKGSQIGVTGFMTVEEWTDRKTNENRSKPKFTGDRLHLLGSKKDNEAPDDEFTPSSLPLAANPSPTASPQTVRAKASVGRSPAPVDDDYDEIPF